MSLTNKQITAKNFQEFYAQIRPYLNGQVPPVFNKFSKSDLYSTDEKIVGRWIDGKPLYQKSFSLTNTFSITTTEQNIDIADLSLYGIDSVVNMYGSCKYSNGQIIVIPNNSSSVDPRIDVRLAYSDDSKLKLYTHRTSGSVTGLTLLHATIQYTKTTDSSVEIGNDTDYSTTEKIVGTWIDGKPLYQRTVSTTAPATSQVVSLFDENNITNCYFVEGYFTDSNGYNVPVNRYDGGNTDVGVSIKSDGTQIYYGVGINGGSKSIVFTVRYTKTTD